MELLGHLLAKVGFGVGVDICVLEEDAELTVEAALDAPAVVGKCAGFGGEFGLFLCTEDVLFEALYGRDPCGFADEGCYFFDVWLDCGEDLDAGRAGGISMLQLMGSENDLPIANQTDVAASQVDVVVPIRSVQKRALVLVDARNRRPLPVVQDTRSIDKNIAMIIHNLSALKILDLHIVSALLLVPRRAANLVPRLNILVQPILSRKVIEVRENLFRARVHSGPVKLGLKRPCVVVRWDVACASVGVLLADRRFRKDRGAISTLSELTPDTGSRTTSPTPPSSSRTPAD